MADGDHGRRLPDSWRARARRAVHLAAVLSLLASCTVALGADAGSSATSDFRCRGAIATLVGTAGNDRLRGTSHDDVIVARAGNDVVYGLAGDDRVCDNDGTDHVLLGPGDDEAGGGRGNDHLEGGSGDDWLAGRRGNDVIEGDAGSDRIVGELGNDTLRGEGGNDNLGGGPGTDDCRGGPGRDRVRTCEAGEPRSDRPPEASDDTDSTSEVTPKIVAVLANDSDPDRDPLSVASLDTAGTQGSVTITPEGTGVRYDPNGRFSSLGPGESATDTFRYSLTGGTGFATVIITVSGMDTDPTAAADTRTVTEDGGAEMIDALANDTDPDGGVAKSIQSVTQPANGIVTITGGGSALTYEPDSDYCNAGGLGSPDNFTYQLAPGGSSASVAVTVDCVNDAPVLMTDGALSYSEGDGAVPVDSGLGALDIDSASLQGAVVQFTANFFSAEDELAFTDQNGIAGTYDSGTGVLTLTGTSSVANYQTALRSVTYENSADTPSTATRTLSFQVTDSSGDASNLASRDIAVSPTNDAPVVTTSAGNAAYDENAAAVAVDGGLTVSDTDDANIEGATARVSSNFQSGDELQFTNQSGITGTYDSGTGVLTLAGTATKAAYQAALRTISFRSSQDDPASSKTVEFKVNDGSDDSNAATRGIAVTASNDAPTLGTTGSTLSYPEGSGPVMVDAGLSASDPDSTDLQGATVQITGNFNSADDELAFTNQLGITGSYNDSTGTLTLSGTTTVANYRAALRTVTYENSSENPSSTRTVSFQATDASGAASNVPTRGISFVPANDAPVVTTSGGSTAYTEGDPATVVDGALTVADPDDTNIESAQVRISGGFQSGDVLDFVNQSGITGGYDSGTGVLTLTGTASKADYQTALRSIEYSHTGDNPGTPKTVEFKANDGDANGNPATKNLAITGVNDASTITTTVADLDYDEDDGPVAVDGGLSLTDPDSTQMQGATVQVTGNFVQAEDELAFTNQNGITGSYNDSTGTLTLSGTTTVASYQAALRSVTYENSADTPSTATRTVSFQATDAEGAASNVATRDITVSPVNDAPVVTTSGGDTAYEEGDPATAIDGALTVTDADDTNIEAAQVRVSANFQAGDNLAFVNQNGISGAYNAGTGVLTLTGTASVADYQTALRSIEFETTASNPSASKTVEFKVNDGSDDSNAATKGIAIGAVNDPPEITSGGTLTYTENDPATAVHSALTVTEPDGDNISGASASITSGFASGEDTLAWTDNNGADAITLGGSSTAQTIVLTGGDTAANYEAALRAVTYANSSQDPSTASRTVTFSATDVPGSTGNDTRTVAVTAVDDPPAAVDDGDTVLEDAAATSVPVLTNDTDVDNGPKTISSASDPANGTVVLTGGSPGTHTGLTYQPDPHYCNDPPGTTPDTFTYTLNGGSTATVSVTVTCVNDAPVADDETFNGNDSAHGNTTMQVDDPDDNKSAPTQPHTEITGDILAGDTDVDGPGPLTVTPGTFATNDGGSVTLESDGDFTFHPAASTSCTDSSDFFDYTVEDSGSPEQTDTGRVTIAIAGCVWYVSNNAAGNSGTSSQPFDTLAQAETASGSNHTVFVFDGDNTSTGYDTGYAMNSGERLIGESEGLVVDPDGGGGLTADTLHPATAGARPSLTANNEDVIALDDGNEVRDFNIDPQGTGGGVAGAAGDTGGGTIDDVNIVDAGTAGDEPGLELSATTGTFSVPDFTYSNAGVPSAAPAVQLMNAGTVSFGAGDAGDPTKINKTGGQALNVLSTGMGTSIFDEITVADSAAGGINLTNITPGSSTTFGDGSGTDLDLTTTGSTAALRLSSAATASVPAGGIADIDATGGPAIDSTGTTPGATGFHFDDVDSTNSASDGINLAGLGSGAFSANSSSVIAGAAGISFDLDGGSGDVTFPGTFNNGAAQTAEITGRTGGAVSFSGPVNDTNDAGGGIALSANSGGSTTFSNPTKTINTTIPGSPAQNNAITMIASDGHTLNLTGGGLDIDSTGRGLQADASGTLTVTGAGNTINSSSGAALDVSNTDIGAADLSFERIDAGNNTAAADPANGIVLSNTGSLGELTVAGTGGTCTNADTSGCSGGTIRNTTGADSSSATPAGTGVVLNNTDGVSLTRMHIHDHSNYGIRGTDVNGFTLAASVINGTNGTSDTSDDSSVRFGSTGGVGLLGSASVTNTHISGGLEDNFKVVNHSGVLNRLTFDGVNIGANSTSLGNDGIMVEGQGTATVNVTLQNSTLTSSRGDLFQMTADGSGGGDLDWTNNSLSNNHPGIGTGGGGVSLFGGAAGTFDINMSGTNTFKDSLGHAILLVKSFGSGNMTGQISGITVGNTGDGDGDDSGSLEGSAIKYQHAGGGGTASLDIVNSSLHEYNNFGIELQTGAGVATNGTMSTNVTGNTVSDPGSNPNVAGFQGIALNSGVTPGDTFTNCLHLRGNAVVGAGSPDLPADDIRVRARQNTTITLPGYGGSLTDTTAIATFLANHNDADGANPAANPPVPTASATRDAGASYSGTGTTCP